MIKINLLPVRAAKKKETALNQVVIFVATLVVVLVVVLSLYGYKRVQISRTRSEIDAANAKIIELKNKIGKLEEMNKLKDQVKKKLDVLAQLRKNKTGPAQRLSTLSDITPDKLWLEVYRESGQDVKISGTAFNEDLIATFMRNLEASPDFTGVDLQVSEQKEINGIKLKRFDISCKLKGNALPVEGPVKK